jgi:periplasmic divalent cation tolerance protein
MKSAEQYRVVLVTAPDLKTARRLAGDALRANLIACANLVPDLESRYRWKGRIQSSREVLMILKTTAANLRKLERAIVAGHPYDTPEFIVLKLAAGNARYLNWLGSNCRALRAN